MRSELDLLNASQSFFEDLNLKEFHKLISKLIIKLFYVQELLAVMKLPTRIRRRRKKKRENVKKLFERRKTAEKKSIVRWKKNAKKCARKSETK